GRDWLRMRGLVVRVDPGTIAIAIAPVPEAFAVLVDETSNASRTNDRRLSVVLIDATVGRRMPIAEAFRAAGCDVIDVATPLDAIVELGASHFEPDLIAIADSLPGSVSDELRRFVEAEHPGAKLVRIGDDPLEPVGLAHWLSTLDPQGDLVARIRRLLVR